VIEEDTDGKGTDETDSTEVVGGTTGTDTTETDTGGGTTGAGETEEEKIEESSRSLHPH
jgi:hypothetical protein